MPARPFYDLVIATLNEIGKGKSWLSQRSGVSRNTIDNWQRQPRAPQAATVAAVADVLNIERDKAFRLAGVVPDAITPSTDVQDMSSDDLLREINRLASELRRRIPDG